LNKEETKHFLKQTLIELGETADFTDEDFDAAFVEFDQDGNQSVDMDEMKAFIIKMANLWWVRMNLDCFQSLLPNQIGLLLLNLLYAYSNN